jgi:hypothetical protein
MRGTFTSVDFPVIDTGVSISRKLHGGLTIAAGMEARMLQQLLRFVARNTIYSRMQRLSGRLDLCSMEAS